MNIRSAQNNILTLNRHILSYQRFLKFIIAVTIASTSDPQNWHSSRCVYRLNSDAHSLLQSSTTSKLLNNITEKVAGYHLLRILNQRPLTCTSHPPAAQCYDTAHTCDEAHLWPDNSSVRAVVESRWLLP